MEYEITEQRRAYLTARGYTILTACPGSGKTTSVVFKLKTLIDEFQSQNTNGVGVLCMSFTNKACDEIICKYREMHGTSIEYPNEVRTIDSFITQFVVLKYWYLVNGLHKPRIINDEEILHNLFFKKYDGGECLVDSLRNFREISHHYSPEEVQYLGDNIYKIKNKTISRRDGELYNFCKAIFKYRFEHGVLNSNDVILIAAYILRKYNIVANSIAQRFPYMILDEAQDTSKLQFEILELLKNAGVQNIELIGDANQSVYEWRNASPDIFMQYTQKEGWRSLNLTENRRSVQRIINLYSRLKPVGTPAIISYKVEDAGIQIEVIRYDNGCEKVAFDRFNDICNARGLDSRLILVRGKGDLTKLAAFRNGIEPWKKHVKVPYRIINAQMLYAQNRIKEAIYKIGWVCAYLIFGEGHFSEMKNYIHENNNSVEFNSMLLHLLASLPSLASSFNIWNERTSRLLKQTLNLPSEPVFEFKQRLDGFCMQDVRNQPINLYYGQVEENIVAAQTIHSAKGASVDAVLLYLHDQSGAQVISFNDIPNNSNGLLEIKEKHRLIYVACSRAKQLLAIAVPSSITEDQIRRKLEGLDVHISSQGVQMSLEL